MKLFNLRNVLVLSALSCASLSATIVDVGAGSVTPTAVTLGSLGSLTLKADSSTSFVDSGVLGHKTVTIDGSLESAVYETSSGNLDFFYQITQLRSPHNTVPLTFLTAPIDDSYAGVNAYYLSSGTPGSEFSNPTSSKGNKSGTPATVSRPGGGIAQFALTNMPVTASSSTISAIFVLTTNAKYFQPDTAVVQGGILTAGTLGAFSPTPEPGFYVFLGVGLAGLFFAFFRRQRLAGSVGQ